jgi:anti-sigma regulatory factor (Ser/Thr protein kinase)
MASSRLRVARDPALALIVRIFVGSVMERWNVTEPVREDLRLAASELFSGAVEAGKGDLVTFELSSDHTEIELRAEDVHPDEAAQPVDLEGWTGRFDLIRALFPDAEIGATVRIRVPVPA